MALWRIREFHDDDLDAAVRMWDDPSTGGTEPVFALSEVIAAVRSGEPAVAAVVGDELVGTAVATVHGERASVLRVSLAAGWRQRGIGSALLNELERKLVASGVHRIGCLLSSDSEVGAAALTNCGYRSRAGVVLYEKQEPLAPSDFGVLEHLGGRMLRSDAWDRLGGMVREKELIERRIILPLARPDVAEGHGLIPPRAIVLFGPPGTGKTSFAKGIAGRLGWPFVELFPSRLAAESSVGLASALREAFTMAAELDNVVVFIDEVEEIAGLRDPQSPGSMSGVTNEMLKLIPAFRELDGRLLVCATNSIRALDTAFLRHGRFDYLVPVGPPDAVAREAIWNGYLGTIPHQTLDLETVVAHSNLFTPADIEFAARRTAQLVFERALLSGAPELASTDEVLQGIAETRPTLTLETIQSFEDDIANHARV
jgi:transitional endoplasmic reticulum ATPase